MVFALSDKKCYVIENSLIGSSNTLSYPGVSNFISAPSHSDVLKIDSSSNALLSLDMFNLSLSSLTVFSKFATFLRSLRVFCCKYLIFFLDLLSLV